MNRHAAFLVLALALSALPAGAQAEIATYYGAAPWDRHSVVLGGEDLDGDGFDDLLVGAPSDSAAGSLAGAVYAYSGKTNGLLWGQYGSSPFDAFGAALALTGDLNGDSVKDVVVGAPSAKLNSTKSPGQVRVLSGLDGSVIYTAWGDDHNEQMGTSVAGSFHWDNGSKADFAGGAPGDDDGGANAGSFRVWSGDHGGVLTTVHGAAGDRLGWSMSGVGDVNSDGSLDLAVGAPYADFIFADVGTVRIYDQNGAQIWMKWGLVAGDETGWSVAPAGDFNNDGYADVLVGEPGNSDNGADAGRVRLFSGVNAFQVSQFRGDGPGDRFGSSLAQLDELDGDAYPDWAAGAPQPVVGAGYARAFSTKTGKVLRTLPGDAAGDEFGSSVSKGGYPLGNSTPAIAVGALRHDGPAGSETGMARLYVGTCQGFVSYCTAGTSASGCQAVLSTFGTPSATAPSGFGIWANNVEGAKEGQFFFGTNGRLAAPWGNSSSYRCVLPPVKRGGVLAKQGGHGTCTGSFLQDMNALWSSAPAKNPGAGAVVQAQLWYRDPSNTSSMTTSLSDAIEFALCP